MFPEVNIEAIKQDVQSILEIILRSVVNNPEAVKVNCAFSGYRLVFEMHTSAEDIGHVIGRRGELISAVRTVIRAIAGNKKTTIDLDYVTEQENLRPRNEISLSNRS